jgi:hypothetical protein
LAKQDGYQTRFLLSSAVGSRELSGASPRCGMASLAGLSSHRTDCRHIALPIVLIGAPFMVVACRSLLGPPQPTTLGAGNWSMAARRLSPYRSRASPRRKLPAFTKLCTTIALAPTRQAKRLYCTSAMNNPLKNHDPRCVCPTCRRFCESAMANKATRNDRANCKTPWAAAAYLTRCEGNPDFCKFTLGHTGECTLN